MLGFVPGCVESACSLIVSAQSALIEVWHSNKHEAVSSASRVYSDFESAWHGYMKYSHFTCSACARERMCECTSEHF